MTHHEVANLIRQLRAHAPSVYWTHIDASIPWLCQQKTEIQVTCDNYTATKTYDGRWHLRIEGPSGQEPT